MQKMTGVFINYVSFCSKHRIVSYKTAAEAQAEAQASGTQRLVLSPLTKTKPLTEP